MKLYLDLCALKRPYDDRSQPRVDAEAAAMLDLIARIGAGEHTFVWSAALAFENDADPDDEIRDLTARFARLAVQVLRPDAAIAARAAALERAGLPALDAAHLAFAETTRCDALITCDDKFQRRSLRVGAFIRVLGPIELLREFDDGQTPE